MRSTRSAIARGKSAAICGNCSDSAFNSVNRLRHSSVMSTPSESETDSKYCKSHSICKRPQSESSSIARIDFKFFV